MFCLSPSAIQNGKFGYMPLIPSWHEDNEEAGTHSIMSSEYSIE